MLEIRSANQILFVRSQPTIIIRRFGPEWSRQTARFAVRALCGVLGSAFRTERYFKAEEMLQPRRNGGEPKWEIRGKRIRLWVNRILFLDLKLAKPIKILFSSVIGEQADQAVAVSAGSRR